MYKNISIDFHGAAREVTGSKHLITTPSGTRILLDCGLIQGAKVESRNRVFPFEPSSIDLMILSHAHIDHSGNIPNLVRQGFRGPIYTTEATIDVLSVMLRDSARIQEDDVSFVNKRRQREGKSNLEPLYSLADVEFTMTLLKAVPIGERYILNDELSLLLSDAGHILGSACINLEIQTSDGPRRVFFSGDVGRYNDRILKAPADFPQADYILLESTYGNRLHDITEDAEEKLLNAVRKTCIEAGGKLLIPAFSLGRTQEIVYALDRLRTEGRLPKVKVFVDSPLSSSATKVMRKHSNYFNDDILDYMQLDPDPFAFPNLKYTSTVSESKEINELNGPAIIIAASGMMDAGRIKHHLTKYIEDPTNTLLIVGYCEPSTLGGKILAGEKMVRIYGQEFDVKLNVEVISSYSAHADYVELMRFMSCQNAAFVKKVFLVHGTFDAQQYLQEKLIERGFQNVEIPELNSSYQLD